MLFLKHWQTLNNIYIIYGIFKIFLKGLFYLWVCIYFYQHLESNIVQLLTFMEVNTWLY